MKKLNVMKLAGVLLPIVTAGISLATSWFEDKKLDEKVTEKVSEALSNAVNKES